MSLDVTRLFVDVYRDYDIKYQAAVRLWHESNSDAPLALPHPSDHLDALECALQALPHVTMTQHNHISFVAFEVPASITFEMLPVFLREVKARILATIKEFE